VTDDEAMRAAAAFWSAAGGPAPFPRCLEEPIAWALPLAVARLPRLWLADAAAWLAARGLTFPRCTPDRPLHACVVAWRGRGWVLLDGTDPDDERRFSLAHEAAHFMLDYLGPRQRAAARLGVSALDIMDGLRPPTIDERIDALLAGGPLGVHTHLLERRADGGIGCDVIAGAEGRADRLAMELLAPKHEVRRRLAHLVRPAGREAADMLVSHMLVTDFGLPGAIADVYGRHVAGSWYGGRTIRDWLGWTN
jgi:hypothetical protein